MSEQAPATTDELVDMLKAVDQIDWNEDEVSTRKRIAHGIRQELAFRAEWFLLMDSCR